MQLKYLWIAPALLLACGPGQPSDPEPEPDPVDASCQTFCEFAQQCGDDVLADVWTYEDDQTAKECAELCVQLTHGSAIENQNPACEDVLIAMWDCGSSVPTCFDFQWFLYGLHKMTGLNNTMCPDEIYDFYATCN